MGMVVAMAVLAHGARGYAEDVEALFKKGTELRRKGRDAEALVEFQHAARVQDSPRASAQMALAEQALGLWLDANLHLGRALEHPKDPWVQKNREALDAAHKIIRTHLCQVEVWGAPSGAEVSVDDKRVGALPNVDTWVEAGAVALEVKANGYVSITKTLKLPEGGHIREHADLRRANVVAPVATAHPSTTRLTLDQPTATSEPETLVAKPAERSDEDPGEPPNDGADTPIYRRWWFWTAIGAGVVAAGGTTAWLLTHKRNDSAVACVAPTCAMW